MKDFSSRTHTLNSWSLYNKDSCLSALLFIQCLITFVFIPIVTSHLAGPWLVDFGLLTYAVVCAVAYANRLGILAALLASMLAILLTPVAWNHFLPHMPPSQISRHEAISFAAFCFNALVTVLVARHVFGRGKVTRHRILGAILIYLNVAVLFSIAFDLLDGFLPGAIREATGSLLSVAPGGRTAELSYFSLTTITTCGYGDFIPYHPLARSLANLEAVFGQLFPATFVARLVALHSTHSKDAAIKEHVERVRDKEELYE